MNSLYAQYVKEREGVTVKEASTYFYSYKEIGEELHILDMFIVPEHRFGTTAKVMMDDIESFWKFTGKRYIVSQVIVGLSNTEKSLSLQFRWGMKVLKCEGNKILTYKDNTWGQ